MSMRWTIALLLLGAAIARAEVPATLDPAAPQLGERATLRLAEAVVDSAALPRAIGASLRATADPRVFEVVVTRVGEAAIALPATADTLRWEVEPRLVEASADSLRPWMSIGDLGPRWWPTIGLVVVLLGAFFILLSGLRRRAEPPIDVEEIEAPHLIALRRLEELAARGWIAAGRFDEFYVEASHTLRAYVTGRFGVPALDWTTEETVERLLAAGHDHMSVAPIDPLLRAADVVKFAGQRPSDHQAEQWLVRARAWIEGTAVPIVYSTPEALRAAHALRPRRTGGRR